MKYYELDVYDIIDIGCNIIEFRFILDEETWINITYNNVRKEIIETVYVYDYDTFFPKNFKFKLYKIKLSKVDIIYLRKYIDILICNISDNTTEIVKILKQKKFLLKLLII